MSRGGRRGTRKLREARPEHLPPKPRANAKTKLCKYDATGKCVNGTMCDFAHGITELRVPMHCHSVIHPACSVLELSFPQPFAPVLGKPSWTSVFDSDDVSTCLSDGEGSSLSSSQGFSRQSTEESHLAAEEKGACGSVVGFHTHLGLNCSGVTVKNTFLQFGLTNSTCSVRRACSAT